VRCFTETFGVAAVFPTCSPALLAEAPELLVEGVDAVLFGLLVAGLLEEELVAGCVAVGSGAGADSSVEPIP
jgi:hypothetical protein